MSARCYHRTMPAGGSGASSPAAVGAPEATARALHARDPSADAFGIRLVDVAAGRAVVEMTVAPWMGNGLDTCHGGVVFTLADSAMAFASNSHGEVALAIAASIDLLAPVPVGAVVRATATEVEARGRTAIHDVVVELDDGSVVALFRGRTRRVGRPVLDASIDGGSDDGVAP